MAVVLAMKDTIKPNRVDIVKTIVSHGWDLYLCMQDDGRKTCNRIKEARIFNYLIKARTRMGDVLVTYQPEINEITVIGSNAKIEQEMKQEIANILIKSKKGTIYKNRDMFLDGIFRHNRFLTEQEIAEIASEFNKPDDNLGYFA